MKPILLTIFLIIPFIYFNQLSFGPSIMYGKSDADINVISNRAESNYTESLYSFEGGAFVEYEFKPWFSMQLDILYDQINYTKVFTIDPSDINRYSYYETFKLHYLSVPLTMQFQYKKINFNIGYQTSFLLDNNIFWKSIYNGEVFSGTSNNMSYQQFLKKNISFVSSVSYNVFNNFYLEAKYTKGLSGIMDAQAGYTYHATTEQFLFGINYKFSIKKKE